MLCPQEPELQRDIEECKIPIGLIEKIELSLDNSAAINTKHLQTIALSFHSAGTIYQSQHNTLAHHFLSVLDSQQQFVRRINEMISSIPNNCFAFSYQEEFIKDRWTLYDIQEEFFVRLVIIAVEHTMH